MSKRITDFFAKTDEIKVQKLEKVQEIVETDYENHVSACAIDIADFSFQNLTRLQKERILNADYKIHSEFNCPKTTIGKQNRSFQKNWITDYPGLAYSEGLDGCFCVYCLVFTEDRTSSKQLVTQPYRNWKKARDHFNEHFLGLHAGGSRGKSGGTGFSTNSANAAKAQGFLAASKGEIQDPLHLLDKRRTENVTKNRKVLNSVISTVLFCFNSHVIIVSIFV